RGTIVFHFALTISNKIYIYSKDLDNYKIWVHCIDVFTLGLIDLILLAMWCILTIPFNEILPYQLDKISFALLVYNILCPANGGAQDNPYSNYLSELSQAVSCIFPFLSQIIQFEDHSIFLKVPPNNVHSFKYVFEPLN
ncbi:hypothetical protein ACJX0J_030395, partial [Zea mays]